MAGFDELGKILIVIPARGGSKRLPRKNLLLLGGRPLICWTIEAALATNLTVRIVVTSDDPEILAIADAYVEAGVVSHKRPCHLATDTATSAAAAIDALKAQTKAGYEADTIILLQPTSPLRTADDIRTALLVFSEKGCNDTIVTVCEVDHPTAWVGTVEDDSRLSMSDLNEKRSQDLPKEYRLNGAVYVTRAEVLLETQSFLTGQLWASVMPRERSFDIDEEIDFYICESLIIGR